MKLRDHPLMRFEGKPNWPPIWTGTKGRKVTSVTEEIGKLIFVYADPGLPGRCFLVIDHAYDTYVGSLIFDDHNFCKLIMNFLDQHLQKTIREIGDLEL